MKQKLFFLALSFGILVGCGEDEPTKSVFKQVLSFKFSSLTPAVTGTIHQSNGDGSIEIMVPNGTDVTNLAPTIIISEKATIDPASGVARDFSEPVAYTVTAEDGLTAEYIVTVTFDEPSFTVGFLSTTQLQQDNVVIIDGTNFGTDYTKNKIVLINVTTGQEFVLQAASISTSDKLYVKIPADLPLGTYKLVVYKGQEHAEHSSPVTIVYHSPAIESIDKTEVTWEGVVTVSGNYFMTSGNKIFIYKIGGADINMPIQSESKTEIKFSIPVGFATGDYNIGIISNGMTRYYNAQKLKVVLPPTTPVISNINNFTFKRGDTMTITGTNLKKTGFATNINFTPFTSGTTQVKSGVVNSEGTILTYVIPNDFPVGTYVIVVEVGGEFSEEYGEVIQITAN